MPENLYGETERDDIACNRTLHFCNPLFTHANAQSASL